jgi:trehalose 6-phosphate phosphatase
MKKNILKSLCEIADYISPKTHLVLGLDFDGTLVPIQDVPSSVFIENNMRSLLDLLSKRENITIAIISGRSLDDLIEKVGLSDVVYAGNHGLNIMGPGLRNIDIKALQKQQTVEKAFVLCKNLTNKFSGIFLEDKTLTFSIHYRNLNPKNVQELHLSLKNMVSELGDLVIKTGKCVFEIYPAVETNKFTAFSWVTTQIVDDTTNIGKIYLGDDDTDEDVFRSLKDGIGVHVGHKENSFSNYFVKDPIEVKEFLSWLSQHDFGLTPTIGKF